MTRLMLVAGAAMLVGTLAQAPGARAQGANTLAAPPRGETVTNWKCGPNGYAHPYYGSVVDNDHIDEPYEIASPCTPPAVIKAGTYPGQDKDNQVSAVWNILVTGDKMSDQEAYDIVKLIVDKKADLVAVHQDAASFSVENQIVANTPVPWHPGAAKFFKERGAKM